MNTQNTQPANWSDTTPAELGSYWFFGNFDKNVEVELHMVHVNIVSGQVCYHSPSIPNLYTFRKPQGKWTPVVFPQLPA